MTLLNRTIETVLKNLAGKYPVVTGLEHDEWGHPSANPEIHEKMTAKRREKLMERQARRAEKAEKETVQVDDPMDDPNIDWGEAVRESKLDPDDPEVPAVPQD